MRAFIVLLSVAASSLSPTAAERINHEGRILGPAPVVTTPTLFNTAAADAIVVRDADHAGQQRVERRHLRASVAREFRQR